MSAFAGICGLYILTRLDTGKSAEYTMLSPLTTFGFVSGHDFSRAVKVQTKLGFSPCAFFWSMHGTVGLLPDPLKLAFNSSFVLAGAKALIILARGGTTEVVP